MNTGDRTRTFRIRIAGIEGIHLHDDKVITIVGGEIGAPTVSARVKPDTVKSGAHPISFSVEDVADAAVAVSEQSKFWMP